MNKFLNILLVGFVAASVSAGAFAADAAKPADAAAVVKEKPAAPAKKGAHHAKKAKDAKMETSNAEAPAAK